MDNVWTGGDDWGLRRPWSPACGTIAISRAMVATLAAPVFLRVVRVTQRACRRRLPVSAWTATGRGVLVPPLAQCLAHPVVGVMPGGLHQEAASVSVTGPDDAPWGARPSRGVLTGGQPEERADTDGREAGEVPDLHNQPIPAQRGNLGRHSAIRPVTPLICAQAAQYLGRREPTRTVTPQIPARARTTSRAASSSTCGTPTTAHSPIAPTLAGNLASHLSVLTRVG